MIPGQTPHQEEAAMSVFRFEPFRDPDRLMSMAASGTRAPLGMPMDVYRGQDGSYHVEADLPGADPDSVEVTVEHSTLTIQAERTPHYGDSAQVIVAERPQGSFARQLSLGEGVDSENLTAGYADGVLHVTIPRHRRPRPAGLRSPMRPGAAASCRGAPSSRVRRPPAARAAAPAECPCTLPPQAVPALPASARGHAGSTTEYSGGTAWSRRPRRCSAAGCADQVARRPPVPPAAALLSNHRGRRVGHLAGLGHALERELRFRPGALHIDRDDLAGPQLAEQDLLG